MGEVILVRPGQTTFDEQNRIQGLLDLPLSERGRQHIHEVADQLRALLLDVILTDPGEPARTTAQQLGELLDVPVKEKAELRNLDQGLWQGLQLDDVRRMYPKLLKQWQDHPETICPPEGEPVCNAMRRVGAVLKKPLKKYDRMVIVAADPLATLIAGMLLGLKPEFRGPMCSHAGCCVQRFSTDPLSPREMIETADNGRPLLAYQATALASFGHEFGA